MKDLTKVNRTVSVKSKNLPRWQPMAYLGIASEFVNQMLEEHGKDYLAKHLSKRYNFKRGLRQSNS